MMYVIIAATRTVSNNKLLALDRADGLIILNICKYNILIQSGKCISHCL